MYLAAFFLVLVAAAFLLVGMLDGSLRPVVVSVVASLGALLLLWAGVARSSQPPQRDGHD